MLPPLLELPVRESRPPRQRGNGDSPADDDDDDDDSDDSDDSNGYSSDESRVSGFSVGGRRPAKVAWLPPLPPSAGVCVALALGVARTLVEPPAEPSHAPVTAPGGDEEVRKVLRQRAAAAVTQRRGAVWAQGRAGGLGVAIVRLALPPPPPPVFLALPPPELWCQALNALACLAAPNSDVAMALMADPHVSAAALPSLADTLTLLGGGGGGGGNGEVPSTTRGRSPSVGGGAPLAVTLTGVGCAVHWLLLGPGPTADALAATNLATRCGGPGRRRPRGGDGGGGIDRAALASEAGAGAVAVLGACQALVEAVMGSDEGGCMMAVNAGCMSAAMAAMMMSPGMGDELSPPVPPVKLALQALANAAHAVVVGKATRDADGEVPAWSAAGSPPRSHGRDCAASGAAACRFLRMVLAGGGEAAKQLALRATLPLQLGDCASEGPFFPEEVPLLDGVLRLLEALLGEQAAVAPATDSEGCGVAGDGRSELAVSLLGLLSAWLHGCPMAVAALLAQPENLFLVEVASQQPMKPAKPAKPAAALNASGNASSNASGVAGDAAGSGRMCGEALAVAVHGMATLVLGVCMEETLQGEAKTRAAAEKARAKAKANARAARHLRRREAREAAAAEAAGARAARARARTEAAAARAARAKALRAVGAATTDDDGEGGGVGDSPLLAADAEAEAADAAEAEADAAAEALAASGRGPNGEDDDDDNSGGSGGEEEEEEEPAGPGSPTKGNGDEWTSETLQRTIVGRVGFGKFSRTLAAMAKQSPLLLERSHDPWAVCGGGFAAFVRERAPAVQAALVEAYRGKATVEGDDEQLARDNEAAAQAAQAAAEAAAAALAESQAALAESQAEVAALREQLARSMAQSKEASKGVNKEADNKTSTDGAPPPEAPHEGAPPPALASAASCSSPEELEAMVEAVVAAERGAWAAERAALVAELGGLQTKVTQEVGGTERILAEAAARVAFLEKEVASAGEAGKAEGFADG